MSDSRFRDTMDGLSFAMSAMSCTESPRGLYTECAGDASVAAGVGRTPHRAVHHIRPRTRGSPGRSRGLRCCRGRRGRGTSTGCCGLSLRKCSPGGLWMPPEPCGRDSGARRTRWASRPSSFGPQMGVLLPKKSPSWPGKAPLAAWQSPPGAAPVTLPMSGRTVCVVPGALGGRHLPLGAAESASGDVPGTLADKPRAPGGFARRAGTPQTCLPMAGRRECRALEQSKTSLGRS